MYVSKYWKISLGLISDKIGYLFKYEGNFSRLNLSNHLLRLLQTVFFSSVSSQSRFLQALLMLMDHPGLMHWSQVSDEFVSKIAENITGRAKQEDNTLLVSSLNIIDLILNSKK